MRRRGRRPGGSRLVHPPELRPIHRPGVDPPNSPPTWSTATCRRFLAQASVQSLSGQQAEARGRHRPCRGVVGARADHSRDGLSSAEASLTACRRKQRGGNSRVGERAGMRRARVERRVGVGSSGEPWGRSASVAAAGPDGARSDLTGVSAPATRRQDRLVTGPHRHPPGSYRPRWGLVEVCMPGAAVRDHRAITPPHRPPMGPKFPISPRGDRRVGDDGVAGQL